MSYVNTQSWLLNFICQKLIYYTDSGEQPVFNIILIKRTNFRCYQTLSDIKDDNTESYKLCII
ncbi:hypothetical protein ARAF_0413 [Arsenophonus endosymbiont of Aleurodicus floccissimus]|nr:hypothetical protein ARAF_0413 [Arsenophonus endosymbiont of Aleurodicus floccissimus]